jgi:KDO2-lipid IV(A) lauroyltransferase
MSRFVPVHPIYKLQSNKVINWVMERQRQRTFEKTIERSNMREVVRSLKQNRVVWYAVDQDYGRQHSVFADFFGQRCATIAHIGRVANLTNAPVLLYGYHRHQQGYHLSLHAMPADFPSQLEVENATIMNQQMEWLINQHPEQYFWTHRRFKTQEKADAPSPY